MLDTNYANYSGQAIYSNPEPFVPRSSFTSPEKGTIELKEYTAGSVFVTDSSTVTRALFKTPEVSRDMPLCLGAGSMFNEQVPGFTFPEGLRGRLSQVFRWPVDVEEVLRPYFAEDRGLGPKLMYWVQVTRFDDKLATSLLSGNGHRWRVLKSVLRVNDMESEFDFILDKCMRPVFPSECDALETKIYSEWLKTFASAPHLLNNSISSIAFAKRGDPNITPILCEYHSTDDIHENGISPQLELSGACALTYAMNKYPNMEHNVLAINNEGPRVSVTWMWSTRERVLQKQLIGQFNIVEGLGWYRYCVFVSRLPSYLQLEAEKYNAALRTVGQKRAREQQYKAPSTLVVTPVEEPAVRFAWLLKDRPKNQQLRWKRRRYS